MKKTMTATEARVHFGEALRFVSECDTPIYVYKDGKPAAVLLSVEAFERWEASDVGDQEPEWMRRARQAREMIARVRGGVPYSSEEIKEMINTGREDEID